jgi:hypothetical protein
MINQQEVIVNGKTYLYTKSDKYVLEQVETGARYDEAYDLIPCQYTYVETDEELAIVEPIEEIEK